MRVEAWLDQGHWTHGGRITCHPVTRPSQFSDDDVEKDDDDDDSWEEDRTSPSQQTSEKRKAQLLLHKVQESKTSDSMCFSSALKFSEI